MNRWETPYQEFIFTRSYSRWNYDLKRRENWEETVDRYFTFILKQANGLSKARITSILRCRDAVLARSVLPSMRLLWSAGQGVKRENISAYNCAYTPIDSIKVFSEIMYILLCGTGVGYSVERQEIEKLPEIPQDIKPTKDIVIFEDTKIGWAKGLDEYLGYLLTGNCPNVDFSKIRPEGSILKVSGGRASGPEPLRQLITFTTKIFKGAEGRKLTSLECCDLVCYIANVVVAGGVRRAACICLSNLSDLRMRDAKKGTFWTTNEQRNLANNSTCYTEKPDMHIFMEEWLSLSSSGTGERGIFNREAAKLVAEKTGRRDSSYPFGCNPCSEIILRPKQFCNLTEVVVRPKDTISELTEKVEIATILGILQSTLTDFKYLSPEWKKNCEEERLLGVSLTGIMDNPVLNNMDNPERVQDWYTAMKKTAIKTAASWSKALNINMPAAITCVKPSGTVSQLVNSSSGLHARHSEHYIRRVRVSKTDPLSKLLIDNFVPYHPENGFTFENCNTLVFEFMVDSPKNSVFRDDRTAIEQLEMWKLIQEYWCEHKPSCTVYVKDNEWLEVGAWVYKNWDIVSGIAFLPHDGGVYQLPPYTEISKNNRDSWKATYTKTVDFSKLTDYEKSDYTTGSRELACTGESCEI